MGHLPRWSHEAETAALMNQPTEPADAPGLIRFTTRRSERDPASRCVPPCSTCLGTPPSHRSPAAVINDDSCFWK
ncbi:hypothetical protein EYF80_044071 [Liparis tanakae]|uniref:Uncharacterized protein n=1 Tax=Liparis tanakae TaxID=230148 RepID=A0A4Z2FXW1_9TELE|nr:hypothetical protein EYF80_044071 [Liparis tanakae]